MPVLMNKSDVPTLAAWLFFTPRWQFQKMRDAIRDTGAQAGVINVDPGQGKPRELVDVHLVMVKPAAGAAAAGEGRPVEDMAPMGEGQLAEDEGQPAEGVATVGEAGDAEVAAAEEEPAAPSPAEPPTGEPAGDIIIGSTTREAAETYLKPRELAGKPWSVNVPDLPGLADFIDHLLGSSPEMRWIVWNIDPAGILRMSVAKDVKAMAGNTLRVKL